jgi:choice-of-anchor C domain-containing protein
MKIRTCLLAGVILLLAVNPSWANLIANGSFESYVVAGTDADFGTFVRYYSPNPDITGWTVTGSIGGYPNNVDLVHSSLYPAFAGTQSLDMEGAVGASGVISQSFATTSGATYNLSFEYANNPYGSGARMDALVTGTSALLDTHVVHNTSTIPTMDYRLFSQNFIADSATTTLQFSALSNSGYGIALDAVSVNTVPLPAAAWLLLSGLGGLGFVMRRRRGECAVLGSAAA